MKKLLITTGLIITTAALAFSASAMTVHAQEDCSGLHGLAEAVCNGKNAYRDKTGMEPKCESLDKVGKIEGDLEARKFLQTLCTGMESLNTGEKSVRRSPNLEMQAARARFGKQGQQHQLEAWGKQKDTQNKKQENAYADGLRPSSFNRTQNIENVGASLRGSARMKKEEQATAGTKGMELELKRKMDAFKLEKKEDIKLYKASVDGATIMAIRNKIIACLAAITSVGEAWACIFNSLPAELR